MNVIGYLIMALVILLSVGMITGALSFKEALGFFIQAGKIMVSVILMVFSFISFILGGIKI